MKYGTQVFEQLMPIFEASVCEAYKTDFLVHDRHMLESTATPGMRYLLMIRPTGTNLLTVGVRDEREYLATCLRQVEPEKQEIHYVEVREYGSKSTRIGRDRAMHLANEKPMLTMKGAKDPFGVTPAMYQFWLGEDLVGTASVQARYERATNRTLVHIGASVSERHHRLGSHAHDAAGRRRGDEGGRVALLELRQPTRQRHALRSVGEATDRVRAVGNCCLIEIQPQARLSPPGSDGLFHARTRRRPRRSSPVASKESTSPAFGRLGTRTSTTG